MFLKMSPSPPFSFPPPVQVLADYDSFVRCQRLVEEAYKDQKRWLRMVVHNIANAGVYVCACRCVRALSVCLYACVRVEAAREGAVY